MVDVDLIVIIHLPDSKFNRNRFWTRSDFILPRISLYRLDRNKIVISHNLVVTGSPCAATSGLRPLPTHWGVISIRRPFPFACVDFCTLRSCCPRKILQQLIVLVQRTCQIPGSAAEGYLPPPQGELLSWEFCLHLHGILGPAGNIVCSTREACFQGLLIIRGPDAVHPPHIPPFQGPDSFSAVCLFCFFLVRLPWSVRIGPSPVFSSLISWFWCLDLW